ncbi:MAG: AAA family ATPase [Bilifractor sp.]|jgi:cytidylate kinase
MNTVITVSRRYGSGTSVIVNKLASMFHIPVYGKDYICRNVQDQDDMDEQNALIKELAKEPCIIVGRGASEVLKDQPNVLNIYIFADRKDRIKRIAEKENLSLEEAEKKVKAVDRERGEYYEKNTGKYWGDFDNYDLILDSSRVGIEKCADIIVEYLRKNNII